MQLYTAKSMWWNSHKKVWESLVPNITTINVFIFHSYPSGCVEITDLSVWLLQNMSNPHQNRCVNNKVSCVFITIGVWT